MDFVMGLRFFWSSLTFGDWRARRYVSLKQRNKRLAKMQKKNIA
jgi:hypothetical protein